jgi:hypothetical protein
MSTLTLAQLQQLAASVGFPDPALAAAVAMAESGGNPCAQGDPNIGSAGYLCTGPNGTSKSMGLWQVDTDYNPSYDAASLLNPTYNAQAALAISSQGTNWNPWTTYRTGAYKPWYKPYIPPPATAAQRISNAQAVLLGAGMLAAAAYAAYRLSPPPTRRALSRLYRPTRRA